MAGDGESLESCLNKATNPSNRQEEWEHIMAFSEQVNKDPEGPQVSLRLLVHKIQSPQEWEALQALTVLETCMKKCGSRFHSEVAKFKFLNELVKVISPKYLGDTLSERVKAKVSAMLYGWTVSLPGEAKISQAYQMLKSQDVLSADPEISLDADASLPSPRQQSPVIGDEKKNKRLSELLKSKNPGDLQEANQLIKNMVKEDEVRAQKETKQKRTLESVDVSSKLLNDMLAHYSPDTSTDGDKELIKELYSECDKLRQIVCQMAAESEDNDSSLGDILQASDDLTHSINSYKRMEKELTAIAEIQSAHQTQASAAPGTSSCTEQSEVLIDLAGLDVQSSSPPQTSPASVPAALPWGPADPLVPTPNAPAAGLSLLDQDLISLGLGQSTPESRASTLHVPRKQLESGQDLPHLDLTPLVVSAGPASAPESSSAASSSFHCLGPAFSAWPLFAESEQTARVAFPPPPTSSASTPAQSFGLTSVPPPRLPAVSLPAVSSAPPADLQQNLLLLDAQSYLPLPALSDDSLDPAAPTSSSHSSSSSPPSTLLLGETQEEEPVVASPTRSLIDETLVPHSLLPVLPPVTGQDGSLANVFVPLDAIEPSKVCPVTAYDRNGIRLLLHLAANSVAGRPDVLVMVASMLSTAPLLVRDVVLQAAVPKMMKVRLQQPSGTELAPFNPILPPASITQVVLLANPFKEKIRMRFKLSFTLGEKSYTEVGEVTQFPPAHTLEAL